MELKGIKPIRATVLDGNQLCNFVSIKAIHDNLIDACVVDVVLWIDEKTPHVERGIVMRGLDYDMFVDDRKHVYTFLQSEIAELEYLEQNDNKK